MYNACYKNIQELQLTIKLMAIDLVDTTTSDGIYLQNRKDSEDYYRKKAKGVLNENHKVPTDQRTV